MEARQRDTWDSDGTCLTKGEDLQAGKYDLLNPRHSCLHCRQKVDRKCELGGSADHFMLGVEDACEGVKEGIGVCSKVVSIYSLTKYSFIHDDKVRIHEA